MSTPSIEEQRQQLAAERAAFRRERAMHIAERQVVDMARRLGVRRPEIAWRALSRNPDALGLDLQGDMGATNIVEPLRQLIDEIPELRGPSR